MSCEVQGKLPNFSNPYEFHLLSFLEDWHQVSLLSSEDHLRKSMVLLPLKWAAAGPTPRWMDALQATAWCNYCSWHSAQIAVASSSTNSLYYSCLTHRKLTLYKGDFLAEHHSKLQLKEHLKSALVPEELHLLLLYLAVTCFRTAGSKNVY